MDIKGKDVLRYFRKKSLKEKKLLFFIIIGWIGALLCSLYLPILYANIIDVVSSGIADKQQIVHQAFVIVGYILIVEVLSQASRRLLWFSIIPFEIRWIKRIFVESFDYLHRHSYNFFVNNFGWSLVKKVNKLAYSYESIADIFVFNILRLSIYLPLIIIVLFVKNWVLWLISLVFVWVFVVFQFFAYKSNVKNEVESNIHDSKITWVLSDTITNNFNILSFASNQKESKWFKKIVSHREYIKKKTWRKSEYIRLISDILMVTYEVLLIYLSIKLWEYGNISTGTIVLVQAYTLKIFNQMFNLWYVFKNFNKSIGESAEMLKILYTPHEIKDRKNAKKLQVKSGKVEFIKVSFSYDKSWKVFDDLSFEIKPWEKVALVWESWSWKTTIIKLIMRFFDRDKGVINIDNQDISKVTQESLRKSISLVPQDPILFHRSLRENIAYGKEDASEEEIIAVSKMARCHNFIQRLPDKYDTLVGERGIKLSWWERQRVAIARAMLENREILILDEATSSLDSESEMLIQEAMKILMKNKTSIVVAHRLSTIINMDRIIVMDKGKIVEQWSHNELLSKKGIYKKLWDIQSGGFIQ